MSLLQIQLQIFETHNDSESAKRSHMSLIPYTKFNFIKQSRPKTPHSFGEQTVSQDTFAPLASSELLSRERWYKSFLVFSKHSFASGTNCRPKIDRTCRRLFKSPAKDSCFAVQEVTRDLILSTKG